MRRLALFAYLLVLVLAYRVTGSRSGFLVTGLGVVLLLDRYLFHLFPWPPFGWRREVAMRGGSFVGGAVAVWLLRPGVVPLGEAIYQGFMICLGGQILEAVCLATGRRRWGWLPVVLTLLSPWLIALHPIHTVPKRTPAALGLAFEDVRFASRDSTPLAAWLIPHPSARGSVIYCHGHGRNRGQGAGLFPTLHALGLDVLAFDFRGHGDSAGHTSTFGDREVEDLLAAVQYLRARCPDRPLFLMGISLGAAVILQALPRIPDVAGVWSEAAFSRLADTVEHQFRWLPGPLRWPLVHGYSALGWLDCGLWAPSVSPVRGLDRVSVPIYFCHGQKDRLVPWEEGLELNEAYCGPKWHWWVEGAAHYNVRVRNAEEYRRRLRGFVERCLTPGGERPVGSGGS